MKGFNINNNATAEDVRDAYLNGARLLRYQFLPLGNAVPIEHWFSHVQSAIAHLDSVVFPSIPAPDMKVLIDMHSAPGGMKSRKLRLFTDIFARARFMATWELLVDHFKGYPTLLGYGLLNEPAGTVRDVQSLMLQTVAAIRVRDKEHVIAITCPKSTPGNFSDTLKLYGEPNIWAEVHMYAPMSITHQGLLGYGKGKRYPSKTYDRKALERILRGVLKYQRLTNAPIFVGEFSISSFADAESRANYLRDCISLFDFYGWHWTYHAWREGPGGAWSPEGVPQIMGVLHQSLGAQ